MVDISFDDIPMVSQQQVSPFRIAKDYVAKNGKPPSSWEDAWQSFQSGVTRLPLGLMQAESEGISAAADYLGFHEAAKDYQNTANLMGKVAAEQAAKGQASARRNSLNQTLELAPQLGQLAGFGTSLPGIAVGGFAGGALSPKMKSEDLQAANYKPADTYFDKVMSGLSYLPQQAVELAGIEDTRGGQGLAGAATGALAYGAVKGASNKIKSIRENANLPKASEIKEIETQLYNKARESNASFPVNVSDNFAKVVEQSKVAPLPNGKNSIGGEYLNNILDQYSGYEGKPLRIQDVDIIDKNLTGDIQRAFKGGYNYEAGILKDIQKNLREGVSKTEAGAGLADAREIASARFKLNDMQNIIENAYMTDNPASSMRTGFKNYYKQIKKNPRGYSKEEIAAIKYAGNTGLLTGALKTIGSRFISGAAGVVGGAPGGIGGAMLGAAVGEGIGYPMRLAASKLQEARANKPISMVMKRPGVQEILNGVKKQEAPLLPYNPVKALPLLGEERKPEQAITKPVKATKTDINFDDIPVIKPNEQSSLYPIEGDDLFSRVLRQESGGNQNAVSPKGAIGVAQIMPATAEEAAADAGLEWDATKYRTDANYNAALGKAYLEKLQRKYNDDALALMAYNWGQGNVDMWIKSGKKIEQVPEETINYINSILG